MDKNKVLKRALGILAGVALMEITDICAKGQVLSQVQVAAEKAGDVTLDEFVTEVWAEHHTLCEQKPGYLTWKLKAIKAVNDMFIRANDTLRQMLN